MTQKRDWASGTSGSRRLVAGGGLAIAIGVLLLGAGCGDVALRDPMHSCVPGEPGTCPEGWYCRVGSQSPEPLCYPTAADSTDGATDGDGAVLGCAPAVPYCVDQEIWSCTAAGQPGALLETCQAPQTCLMGTCVSPCEAIQQHSSNLGCDFWATPTSNSALYAAFDQSFGLVIHNHNDQDAVVTVTRAGATVEQVTVGPRDSAQVLLSMIPELKNLGGSYASAQVAAGAYHVTSTLPIAVSQFSPLEFQHDDTDSYSNDASLLLPSHALSTHYLVMSWQTTGVDPDGATLWSFSPGFVAIVGAEDNTTVSVTLSAFTLEGPGISAGQPGTIQQYSLQRGEVLQLLSDIPESCTGTVTSDDCNGMGGTCSYCQLGSEYDLTGTIVESTSPVAVFAGNDCAFVPYNVWAGDHLEEQLFPQETWGKEFVVGRTAPQAQSGYADEPNIIRVLSGSDGNVIHFTPAQPTVESQVVLDKGQWVQFEADEDFEVRASAGILVGQYLVGEGRYSRVDIQNSYRGDPAFSLVVPVEQLRSSYTFLAPTTVQHNYVNITALLGAGAAPISLDGVDIDGAAFSPEVGSSGRGVARLPITGGYHTVESVSPFGVSIYGFATFSGYSYPGGLNLAYINPDI